MHNSNSPYINRFLSADTIVPGAGNPQALNRYSYTLNNPLRYTDPTGHMAIGDSDGGCQEYHTCRQEALERRSHDVVKKLGGKDDLEAMAEIIDYSATLFPQYEDMVPALSQIFLGVNESNPLTILNATGADPCAAVGREPKDCSGNSASEVFWDQGFNADFQDRHSQAYHFWAYVATTASTDMPVGGFALGYYTGQGGNFVHEVLGVGDPSGATWQDFALAQAGMNTGEMIAFGLVPPNGLGNYIRDNVGTNSAGAPYVSPLVQFLPLWGNR